MLRGYFEAFEVAFRERFRIFRLCLLKYCMSWLMS